MSSYLCISGPCQLVQLLQSTIMMTIFILLAAEENPWKRETESAEDDWKYPETEAEKLRCAVFRNLWEKQYYLTSGQKFGGDFLAYPGLYLWSCLLSVCMLRVPDQNGVSQTWYIVEIHRSGREPSMSDVNVWLGTPTFQPNFFIHFFCFCFSSPELFMCSCVLFTVDLLEI